MSQQPTNIAIPPASAVAAVAAGTAGSRTATSEFSGFSRTAESLSRYHTLEKEVKNMISQSRTIKENGKKAAKDTYKEEKQKIKNLHREQKKKLRAGLAAEKRAIFGV